jgi:hypothetical protein
MAGTRWCGRVLAAARAVRQDDVQRRDCAQGRVQRGRAQQGALHRARRVRPLVIRLRSRVRWAHVARAYGGACRWLEELCTVLNRIVEAHEKRGALPTNII